MIGAMLALWAEPRVRRAIAGLALALSVVAALAVGKCRYDRALVARHEAAQASATVAADRAADASAADQRVADASRAASETQIIREAIDDARAMGADPRAVYYDCVRRQQAAARAGQPPARC